MQSHLMNTRPSLALGMLAHITMSVPASTVMIVHHMISWRWLMVSSLPFILVELDFVLLVIYERECKLCNFIEFCI